MPVLYWQFLDQGNLLRRWNGRQGTTLALSSTGKHVNLGAG